MYKFRFHYNIDIMYMEEINNKLNNLLNNKFVLLYLY